MSKKKLYIIICVMVLIISIGGTFAWYTWESTNNISANLGFCVPEISFIGGTTLKGEGLVPTTSRDNGLKKQIDVYLNKTCKEGDSGVMNLYMKLDVLPASLRHETFMFEVVKDDVVIFSGNFKDKQEGQTINLLTNRVITEDDSIYFVYVYIDGTRDNPINMSNKSFRFTVWGEGTGAIYKNNVIANPSTPSDSTSKFLNTEIARSSIQTLTIAEDNTVPDTVPEIQTKDISSEGDGSVMLWYTDDDGDGKLDIYMGSENGVIETNTNGQGMFAYLENVESLDLTNLDTSNITNMSSMFRGSKNLKEIKLSNFDTSNVTSMQYMFYNCNNLESLDVSSFDTSKVTTMAGMFSNCSSLTSLDLSNFDTSNVTRMGNVNPDDSQGMFNNCTSLKEINLSGWDTSKVTTMMAMFNNCKSLTSLDISSFDGSSLTTVYNMFCNCSNLKNITFGSDFNALNLKNMGNMFRNCYALESLDLSMFKTSKITAMDNMFWNCTKLVTVNFGDNFKTSIASMNSMFRECRSLTNISLKNFIASSTNNMFNGCSSLTSLDLSNFNTSAVTNMNHMFSKCSKLATVDLSSFNTENVTTMNNMFSASGITEINLSNFNTSNVTDMYYMFGDCGNLVSADLSGFTASEGLTNLSYMFNGCRKLKNINLKKFNIKNNVGVSYMFNYCSSLEELYFNSADFTNVSGTNIFQYVPTTVKIYVMNEEQQNWMLNNNGRGFTVDNIIVSPLSA